MTAAPAPAGAPSADRAVGLLDMIAWAQSEEDRLQRCVDTCKEGDGKKWMWWQLKLARKTRETLEFLEDNAVERKAFVAAVKYRRARQRADMSES